MMLVFVSVSDHLSFSLWLEVVFFHPFYGWVALPLEKVMAPHSSTLAWKVLWTDDPGRLQSMGSLRVGHD